MSLSHYLFGAEKREKEEFAEVDFAKFCALKSLRLCVKIKVRRKLLDKELKTNNR
jgi:hypothetical protein